MRFVAPLLLLFAFGLAFINAGVYPNYRSIIDFDNLEIDSKKENARKIAELKWWQTAGFYQIYPRSFKDSNGDGIGDLNGITDRLAYLKELGITATWLSPIFTSPMADFGYDIANFTAIEHLFGTMADFERLIKTAKQLGVKILLDFVPNHSSDECEWFKRSASSDPDYKDFYVWHPGKTVNGKRQPPTNWISVFRGSAWHWHEGRQEYYLHQFLKKQPDLNYRNPKVRETMNNVLRFWLAKGVDGFRIDAVPHLFEIAPDAQYNWPDEPRNNWVNDPDDYGYLQHIYSVDQPETINLLYEWRAVLDEYQRVHGGDDRILMAETYSPINIVMQYYGNATAEGAQIPFNFLLIENITNSSNAYDYEDTVNTWLTHMPVGHTANWVLGNHDKNRVGSRLGADRIDMMNMLLLTLPGASVTYQGEEIGMTDVWISWNDTVDPSACNSSPDIYETLSRDPERTPFQWNAEFNAGFSNATKTWLPIGLDYERTNVAVESETPVSHLNIYKQLMQLRQQTTYKLGQAEIKALNDAVVSIKRYLRNEHTYLALMNIYKYPQTIDLTKHFSDLPAQLEYVLIIGNSTAKVGQLVLIQAVELLSKEAVILRTPTKLSSSGYYTYYTSGVVSISIYASLIILSHLLVYFN